MQSRRFFSKLHVQLNKMKSLDCSYNQMNCSNSLILLSYVFNEKEVDEATETFMHRLIQERNLISLFPNIAIILRIYLYLMCSNSSGEWSLLKLKRIKNEPRSSMSQRRLNHLSLMSIESELLRKQNCCKEIQEFACKKHAK